MRRMRPGRLYPPLNKETLMLPSSHQPAAAAASRLPNDASTNQADFSTHAASQPSGQPQPQVQARPDGSHALASMAQRSSASIQTVSLSGPPTYVPASAQVNNAGLEPASDAFPSSIRRRPFPQPARRRLTRAARRAPRLPAALAPLSRLPWRMQMMIPTQN
jgi:hypothetical protein